MLHQTTGHRPQLDTSAQIALERDAEQGALNFLSQHTDYAPNVLEYGRWVHIGPRRKRSDLGAPQYKAIRTTGDDGRTFISVTFSTFKHGGYTETWKSWEQKRAFNPTARLTGKARKQASLSEKKQHREDLRKLENYASVIEQWHNATTTGTSQYLESKGVGSIASAVHGIRYSDDGKRAYIPIIDTDGTEHALQKISTGAKLIYGEVSCNFAVIGRDWQAAERIYIAESIGTGLSIYAALGPDSCIVSAMSANNLDKVSKELRRKRKDAKLVICADNDKWNKKTGTERAENPGLEAAHLAALNIKNCVVTYPEGLGPGLTDFNDLHIAEGLGAVAEQLQRAERADPVHAFAEIIRKAKKPRPGATNSRYLSKLDIKPGINLIKSPIETGKTFAMIPHAQGAESFLYIPHLQTLAGDAAERLNLHLYLDVEPGELHYYRHLSVCLNSLYKLSQGGHHVPRYQYVVIDEIEQLLQRLSTKIDNKQLILETLLYLLRNAEHVVLLDAHLGKTTLEFIKAAVPDTPIHWTVNQYAVGTGREIVLHDDDGTILERAAEALRNGKKVFLTCNSKRQARAAYKMLRALLPDKKGLYISGDNGGDREVRIFFTNVNEQAALYDFIVTTPAANTGISIDTDADTGEAVFQFVGGIFKNGINGPHDVLQALGRVRGTKTIHCHIQRKYGAFPRDAEAIKSRWLMASAEAQALGIFPTIGDDGQRIIADSVYSNLCLAVTQKKEQGQYQFFANVLELAAIDGYTFSYQGDDTGTARDTREAARDIERTEYAERIAQADEIDKAEAAKIDAKNRKTLAEHDSLERHELQNFYPSLSIAEALDYDKRGKGRADVLRIENVLRDDNAILDEHKKQAAELLGDKYAYGIARQFGRILLATVGINAELSCTGHTYTRDSENIKQFAEVVIKHRAAFQAVANIPTDKALRANPLKFIGEQLRRYGLKQSRTGRNGSGQYEINAEALGQIAEIVTSRKPALGTHLVFNINNCGMSP